MQLTRFVVQVVLARLIAPEAFGVLAVGLVTIQLLEKVMDLGTGAALIQRPTVSDRLASTVFLVNVAAGSVLGGGLFLSAPMIAGAFGSPEATPVLRALALAVLFNAAGNVQQSLLRRRLRFRALALITVGSALANAAVAVPMAVAGAGVWALVAGQLALSLTASAGAHRLSRWSPGLAFELHGLRSLASYSLNLTAFNLVNFVLRNSDKVIIGRLLGIRALGIYTIAERVLIYPTNVIGNALSQVLFPTLATVQDDHELLRRGVLRASGAAALITFPAMIGIAAVAEPFVVVVLGERWSEAIPLLRVLAPVGALMSVQIVTGVVFTAVGRTSLLLALGVTANSVLLAAFLVGAQFGLIQLTIAYALATVALSIPSMALPLRLIGLPTRRLVIGELGPHLLSSGIMGLVVVGTDVGLAALGGAMTLRLGVGVTVGVAIYLALLAAIRPPALFDLLRVAGLDGLAGRLRGRDVAGPTEPRSQADASDGPMLPYPR